MEVTPIDYDDLEERIRLMDIAIQGYCEHEDNLEAENKRLRETLQQCEAMLREYESVGGDDESDGVYFLIRQTMADLDIAALKEER